MTSFTVASNPTSYPDIPVLRAVMVGKRSRASSATSNEQASGSTSRADDSLPAAGPLVHASQDLDDFQESFWRYQMDLVEQGGDADGNMVDFKSGLPTQGQLPLARIKKVMKSDDQVKMISAEVPVLFARACEIFISDLTCRAFLIAEEHKRRTIQRSDVAGAIGRSDLFDFLIDVVPRHESVPSSRLPGGGAAKREKTGDGHRAKRTTAKHKDKSLGKAEPSTDLLPSATPLSSYQDTVPPWVSDPSDSSGSTGTHPSQAFPHPTSGLPNTWSTFAEFH